jgi:hypothetical protein
MDAHEQHEQRLAAALRDVVQQIDINDYRDSHGHAARNNLAFLKAQAVVDEFGLTHAKLCSTLDDCGDDLEEAARRIWALRAPTLVSSEEPDRSKLAELVPELPTPFQAPD